MEKQEVAHTNARVEQNLNGLEINQDSIILQNRRIDKNSSIPTVVQALRIAIYDQMKAYETYMQIIEKFGEVAPFTHIVEVEKTHYAMLLQLLEKYAVELPIDDFSTTIVIPQTLLEACEIGVVAEIANIKMYDDLIANTMEFSDVQDAFFQLQAVSYNNHLVAFRKAAQSIYAQGFSIQNTNNPKLQNQTINNQSLEGFEQTMSQFNEFSKTIEEFKNGKFDQNSVIKLLNNENVSLIGGAILGAFGAVLLNQTVNNKDENDKSKEGEKEGV